MPNLPRITSPRRNSVGIGFEKSAAELPPACRPRRHRTFFADTILVVGAANLPEPADWPLKFLLVAAPRRYQHHPTLELPAPRRGRSPGRCFRCLFAAQRARRTTGNNQETSSDMNISGVLLPALQANGAPPLSKGRVVTRPLADRRCLTKSGGGALFFPASRATTLAGLRGGETVASQAEITLHQQRNLLVLWALAGSVWRRSGERQP